MTDETKPKRVRGLKEREAAYCAGFREGLEYAQRDALDRAVIDEQRERAMADGLKRLRTDATSAPKRTRQKKLKGAVVVPPGVAGMGPVI